MGEQVCPKLRQGLKLLALVAFLGLAGCGSSEEGFVHTISPDTHP